MTGRADSRSAARDIARRVLADVDEVSRISAPGSGVTRVAYTAEDAAARLWFRDRCREYGLDFSVDTVGNCFAALPGTPKTPLLLGSHLDSVPAGGRYDGVVGVMLGLELTRYFSAVSPELPLCAASFACEESTRFGFGTIGSNWLEGSVDVDSRPPLTDRSGQTLAEVLKRAGISEMGAPSAAYRSRDFRGLIEVHIDQGTVLTSMGARVAVVDVIAGVERTELTWRGQAAHSGGQWREDRHDALTAAASFIVEANQWWRDADPQGRKVQLTVGSLSVEPNSPNTVPGKVTAVVDIRSPDPVMMDTAAEEVAALASEAAQRNRTTVDRRALGRSAPLRMDQTLVSCLTSAAERAGAAIPSAVSLAGHDALVLGRSIPTGMLLLANPSGISHASAEALDSEALGIAVRILIDALPEVVKRTS